MPYSFKEIAVQYHGSVSTLKRNVKKLKQDGKFEKKSAGKFFDEKEAKKIAELLNFTFVNGKAV